MRYSYIHRGGPSMASYRYRAQIPAAAFGDSVNDLSADNLVFTKPQANEVVEVSWAVAQGKAVVVDFCDDHFDQPHYLEMANRAHAVSCPTRAMADLILESGYPGEIAVVPDPFEYPESEAHCNGTNLLWYGHASNLPGLMAVMRTLDDYPLMIVSNSPMAMPWSHEEMLRQFAAADIVVIPKSATYKSPNRAVEAIRQGCFVVAEPHPALETLPGVWLGNLKEGIEWTRQNLPEARRQTQLGQRHVAQWYSPRIPAYAWRNLFDWVRSRSTWGAERSVGLGGSASMVSTPAPM